MGLKYVGLFTKIPASNKRRKWQIHFTLLFITVGKLIYQTDGLHFFPVNSDLTYCPLPPTFDRRLIKRWYAGWAKQQVGLTRVEYWKIKSDTSELDKIWHSKCTQIHPFQKQIHASCLDVLTGISRRSLFFPHVSWSLYSLYVTSYNMVLLVNMHLTFYMSICSLWEDVWISSIVLA